MTSPATPAPDDKKQNRKRNFFSVLAGVGVGILSMTCAAAMTVITAGAGAIGVPCLIIAASVFAFDFVLHFARTDDFKLLPAIGAATVTSLAIGIAFNAVATKKAEEKIKQHQSAPVGSVVQDFGRAAPPLSHNTITYAAATRLMRQAPAAAPAVRAA